MKYTRKPRPNDYIKTTSDRFSLIKPWRGKIRRVNEDATMCLIEWSYAENMPIDICIWVFSDELQVTRRPKCRHEAIRLTGNFESENLDCLCGFSIPF
jgi:hypothetical protein